MKTLKCDLCDHKAEGETFEDWMEAMKPHYKETHADMMQKESEMSRDERQDAMQKWMTENRARFDAA